MSNNTVQIKDDPFVAIRVPEFRFLVLGRFLFITGLRMMGTLVGWWIYELTKDPFAIGLIGLSEVIPAVSLALYSGHVIDKSEKRGLLLRTVSYYFLASLALLFLSTSFFTTRFTPHTISYLIYFIIFCTGIIRAFTGSNFSALIGLIAPKTMLQNATSWSQGSFLSASVTGHALGGFLIAWIGNTYTLLIVSILIALACIVLYQLKPKVPTSLKETATWKSVKEGLQFVYRTKELLGSMTLDMFAVFFGGAVAMVPVFAKDILKVGAIGFGWLNAANDIGAITIVILLAFFPLERAQGKKLFIVIAGFGICIILFAISRIFIISFLLLLLAGILDGISMVIRGTILQLKTPDHMRGRVSSVGSMFINSSNELGQFESGFSSRLLGIVPSVIFGGCMTLLVVVTTWVKAPTLRRFEY